MENIYNVLITKIIFNIIIFYITFKIYHSNIFKVKDFLDIIPKTSLESSGEPNLTEIFQSRELFINKNNLTKEYIRFIRPLNQTEEKEREELINKKKYRLVNTNNLFKKRKNSMNYINYAKLCLEEKLMEPNIFKSDNSPLISVILPSFNKEKVLMKSVRSIQNQSLKNIEIIIVDDCSSDDSNRIYKHLLETDSRIRVFHHLENLGVWRARLDGFLYSRGKYVIHFDTGDLYEDNYVLEDAYNIVEKYNLDSLKMVFRIITNYSNLENYKLPFIFEKNYTKMIYKPFVEKYDRRIFGNYTNVWNRLTKNSIFTKGLYLLSSYILNLYKNLWEDIWWNKIVNKVSYNYLIVERYAYLYFKDGTGEGTLKINTDNQKDKAIHEFIYFLYFNWFLLPKRSNKKIIIDRLYQHNETLERNLKDFKTQHYILDHFLQSLINDRFVSIKDKIFMKKLLKESKNRQKNA